MKRIFYFNINYNCNNRCVFCYSHNTRYNSRPFHELPLERFETFLSDRKITAEDRVILNGGEPLLHTQINRYLSWLNSVGCETLVYTNGRLLEKVPLNALTDRFRFVVPLHGYEALHDSITGIPGSYRETLDGMRRFAPDVQCVLDLKVILNSDMVRTREEFYRTLEALQRVPFNGSVHITKMADTIVSKRNHYPGVEDESAAVYTKLLFDALRGSGHPVKLYDTCVRDLRLPAQMEPGQTAEERVVFYCDYNQERMIPLRPINCPHPCKNQPWCASAVGEYKVLEYWNGTFYPELE